MVWAKGQLRISTVHVVCKNAISRSETKYLNSANISVKKENASYILKKNDAFRLLLLPYLSFTSWNPTGSLYPLLTPPPLSFSFSKSFIQESALLTYFVSFLCARLWLSVSPRSLSISFVLFLTIWWVARLVCLTSFSEVGREDKDLYSFLWLSVVVSAAVKG